MSKLFLFSWFCVLVLAGCNDTIFDPTLRMAEKAPQAGKFFIAGDIDANTALERLYGNLDTRARSAIWRAKEVPPSGEFPAFRTGDETRVSILLAQSATEGGRERFIIITRMIPLNGRGEKAICRTCASAIGGAVFVRRDKGWVLDAWTPFIMPGDALGKAPVAELVATGLARRGVMITGSGGSNLALIAQSGHALVPQFSFLGQEEGTGKCARDSKSETSGQGPDHSVELSFRPGPVSDRFDIHATSNGSDWAYAPKGTQIFRFDGHSYVSVSR